MMGERRVMQEALLYGFSLERHAPDNHLLLKIDRFTGRRSFPLRAQMGPCIAMSASLDRSRPDYLMMRMLIVGSCFGAALRQNGFQVASCVNFR